MAENQEHLAEQAGVSVPERVRQQLHECKEICEKFKTLAQQEETFARQEADKLKVDYESIELPPEYAEIMDKDLKKAVAEFESQIEVEKQNALRQAQARPLLEELYLKQMMLATQVHLLPHRLEFEKIAKEWKSVSEGVSGVEDINATFKAANERSTARLNKELALAAVSKSQLEMILAALKELQELPPEDFRKKRDSLEKRRNKALRNIDPNCNDIKSLRNEVQNQFHELNAKLTRHYQALDLARWESYTLKLDLCRELETLKDTVEEELPKAATRLREIRKRWQDLGAVPREKQNELGPKYYEFTSSLQQRVDEFYKVLRQKRAEIAKAKEALCVEAESLSTSTEWNATGDRLKAMQQQWKELGNAGRDIDKELYAKFRASCDIFFNARGVYWQERQQLQSQGSELKQQLCEAASKLGELAVHDAIREAKRLRAEFQKAPRAGKLETELAAKFNSIMSEFFDGRRNAIDEARNQREALVNELSNLDVSSMSSEKRLLEIKDLWRTVPNVSRDMAAALDAKFKAAVSNVEKSLSVVRQELIKQRGEIFVPAMRQVAKVVEAARAGSEIPEVELDLSAFPRLGAIVTDIIAEGLSDDMEKAIANNTKEFKALLSELEEASAPAESKEVDLAAELAAAIAGNFGSAVFVNKSKEPRDILKKIHALGMVDPAELDELCSKYENLKN